MQKKFIPKPNSFKNTFCVFKEVLNAEIQDLKLSYKSTSGSEYFFTEEGMYRKSNHWGRLANCKWRLITLENETHSKTKIGFAFWSDFYPDNDFEKLYYIEADFDTNTVLYQHRLNPSIDAKAVLRTSMATTKRIKQIRNILQLSSWANYFDCSDLQELRVLITNELIYTDDSLDEVKRRVQNKLLK